MCNHQKDVFAISLMDTVYTKREEAGNCDHQRSYCG